MPPEEWYFNYIEKRFEIVFLLPVVIETNYDILRILSIFTRIHLLFGEMNNEADDLILSVLC